MNPMKPRFAIAGAAVLLAFSGAAAGAESQDTLLRALAGCAALTDGGARLACYDKLAPQVKDALAAPAPAAVASAQPHAPTEEEQKSWFGFDLGSLFGSSPETQTTPEQFGSERTAAVQKEAEQKKTTEIDSITAKLTEYAMTPVGKFIVFLDNGQVWRELPSEDSNVPFKHEMSENTVEIERGLLGSYILHLNGSLRGYKVVRVK